MGQATPFAVDNGDFERMRNRRGMVWVEGGVFRMGSDCHYPEEAPVREVAVDGFWIEQYPVTNSQFAAFVDQTGYITVAERPPDAAHYPGALPHMLYAGSLVFIPPRDRVELTDWGRWWNFVAGASWHQPRGPDSSVKGIEDHPVVHIAYEDALAYAVWAGKDLPREAEFEFASRAGLDGAEFAWGAELAPGGHVMANYWQGEFPWQNFSTHAFHGTSPVTAFPPNGFGICDMIGNVWEWTSDWYSASRTCPSSKPCCVPRNPRGGSKDESYDPAEPQIRIPRKVLKGGSHLCAANYCHRYRPAARLAQPVDTSACHVGFRCVVRDSQSDCAVVQK